MLGCSFCESEEIFQLGFVLKFFLGVTGFTVFMLFWCVIEKAKYFKAIKVCKGIQTAPGNSQTLDHPLTDSYWNDLFQIKLLRYHEMQNKQFRFSIPRFVQRIL